MAKPRVPKKASNDTSVPAAVEATPNASTANGNGDAVAAAPAKPKSTRKPAIVRTEPRANLVPINIEEEIRRLAYLMAERRGFEPGHEAEDWLAAEREIQQRYHQHSA